MKLENNSTIGNQILLNEINNNKLSHAYLFELDNLDDEIVFSFVKKILCKETYEETCNKCNICSRINNGNYPDLKVIKPDGLWIKKEQLIDLQNTFNKKPIESNKMIYIIYEADKMNKASSNTILKFLEEPEKGIIAILLTNNVHNVIDTIVSRCQIINLKTNNTYTLDKYDETITTNIYNFLTYLEKNQISTIAKIDDLWNNIFKQREDIINAFEIIYLIYYLSLRKKLDIEDLKDISIINTIVDLNTIKSLKNKIVIINDIRESLKFNVNTNMLMDKFIIDFSGVDHNENC